MNASSGETLGSSLIRGWLADKGEEIEAAKKTAKAAHLDDGPSDTDTL